MREKLNQWVKAYQDFGITPACAGKTCYNIASSNFCWDHPRVCGKNWTFVSQTALSPGSPPRVREKLNFCTASSLFIRITPACAGKTFPLSQYRIHDQDHPRVCGKNWSAPTQQMVGWGSPPRVREKHRGRLRHPYCCGITPACAGKTIYF